jgi:NADH-quinone oxidoreductase subunit M
MATLAFALTGYIADQAKTRNLDALGGIAKKMPFISTCSIMVALASAGVPGFANFVAEIMILLGAWDQYRWLTVLAILGIVLGAIYMLKIIRLALQGPLGPKMDKLVDAQSFVEKFPYILLLAFLIWVGCFPSTLIQHIQTSTQPIANSLQNQPLFTNGMISQEKILTMLNVKDR